MSTQVASTKLELPSDLASYVDLDRKYSSKLRPCFEWRRLTTFVPNKNLPVHRWFHCSQAFSAPLVDRLLARMGTSQSHCVLDPFSGVGTTVLTCKDKGILSKGVDIFPLFCFVSSVKLRDNYNLSLLEKRIEQIARNRGRSQDLEPPSHPIFLKAFSSKALGEILLLRESIRDIRESEVRDFMMLGLLSIINQVSYAKKAGAHYRFINADNAGVRHLYGTVRLRQPDVGSTLTRKLREMLHDVSVRKNSINKLYSEGENSSTHSEIYVGDARDMAFLENDSVDRVITSPPYLNRDSYVAQYKMELFLAEPPHGVHAFDEYRELTFRTLRSHVEARATSSDTQSRLDFRLVDEIEDELHRRTVSHKDVPKMVRGYFEDMELVLKELWRVMKDKGQGAMVIGNVRFGGLHIPVDTLLSSIAERIGFNVQEILIARYKFNSPQQMRRYGKVPVRESIILFRK